MYYYELVMCTTSYFPTTTVNKLTVDASGMNDNIDVHMYSSPGWGDIPKFSTLPSLAHPFHTKLCCVAGLINMVWNLLYQCFIQRVGNLGLSTPSLKFPSADSCYIILTFSPQQHHVPLPCHLKKSWFCMKHCMCKYPRLGGSGVSHCCI